MSAAVDQADGLRRMLNARRARMIAVAGLSRGVGATTAAMNLCVEIARQQRRVVLLDEAPATPGSACRVWALPCRGTLADVAARRLPFADAASTVNIKGLTVIPAGPSTTSFNPRSLCPDGVIVVDAALDARGQFSPLAQLADDVVIVMQPTAASITAAYAGLKQMQFTHALRTFQFLLGEVPHARLAQVVISNVMNTSTRHLAVALHPLGWVTSDVLVRDAARLHKSVCEAYPSSLAAQDFRRIAASLCHSRADALAREAAPSSGRRISPASSRVAAA